MRNEPGGRTVGFVSETKTDPISLNLKLVDNRLGELGAETDEAKARWLGVNKSTLSRWRRGQMDISLSRAVELANRLGVELSAIVGADSKPGPPSGPGDDRPPSGPKEG